MFECDENKNARNKVKHKISFEIAAHVFNDNHKIIAPNKTTDCEERFQVLVEIEGVLVLIVVFTPLNTKIRIISARPASKKMVLYNNEKINK